MAKPRAGPPTGRARRATRTPNQLSDVREAALALFAARGYRSTGMRDIVLNTLDAVLAAQTDAVASTNDVVEQLRRTAESQVRYFARFPRESIVTTRDFAWADDADLPGILVRRNDYRHRIAVRIAGIGARLTGK